MPNAERGELLTYSANPNPSILLYSALVDLTAKGNMKKVKIAGKKKAYTL